MGLRNAALAQAPDKRDTKAEAENNARLAAIDARIAEIDKELAAKFPDYAALASPAPLTVEDVQAQLRPDEALVLFLDTPEAKPTPEETFIWVVTKTDVRWVRSELGTPALTREVQALRCGLDDTAWDDDGTETAMTSQSPNPPATANGLLSLPRCPSIMPAPMRFTKRCSAKSKTSSRARASSSCPPARSRSCRFRCW